MNHSHKKVILGIDPGTNIMGYGLLVIEQQKLSCQSLGVIKFTKIKDEDPIHRLSSIYSAIQELIQKHQPTELAIESPFLGKNVQSMLKLGRAQGVAIAACLAFKLNVCEYAPKTIKLSITGNGNSDKEAVFRMLERILSIKIEAKYLDATDALAAAVCHYFKNSKNIV